MRGNGKQDPVLLSSLAAAPSDRRRRVVRAYAAPAAPYVPVAPTRGEIACLSVMCFCLLAGLAALIFLLIMHSQTLFDQRGRRQYMYPRPPPPATEFVELDPARRTLPPVPERVRPNASLTAFPSAYRTLKRVAIITLNDQTVRPTTAPPPTPSVYQQRQGRRGRQGPTHDPRKKAEWLHPMSFANKQAYCKKWGYDLIIEDGSLLDPSRDPAWGKVPILKKWLPKYQWLMWVDMDAFFMRFDLPITDLLSKDHDLVITKDWHGINFGIFAIRNTEWSFQLLDLMWYSPRKWWEPWQEQSALMALLHPLITGPAAAELRKRIFFAPQRSMNSYPNEFAYGNRTAKFQDGDRIAHFPNCKGIVTCRGTVTSFYRLTAGLQGLPWEPTKAPATHFPPENGKS